MLRDAGFSVLCHRPVPGQPLKAADPLGVHAPQPAKFRHLGADDVEHLTIHFLHQPSLAPTGTKPKRSLASKYFVICCNDLHRPRLALSTVIGTFVALFVLLVLYGKDIAGQLAAEHAARNAPVIAAATRLVDDRISK